MPVTPLDALRALSRASGATFTHLDTRRAVRRSLSNEGNLRSYVLSVLNFTIVRAARELAASDDEANAFLETLKEEAATASSDSSA